MDTMNTSPASGPLPARQPREESRTNMDTCLPRAREDGLLVRTLGDETLVYDLRTHRAHCLSPVSAAVWRRCDGTTPAAMVIRDLNLGNIDSLALILFDLHENGLLSEPDASTEGISRRDLVKKLGIAAAIVAVPTITSIAVPTAAEAGSLLPSGSSCQSGTQCASGVCSGGTCQ